MMMDSTPSRQSLLSVMYPYSSSPDTALGFTYSSCQTEKSKGSGIRRRVDLGVGRLCVLKTE
jgi:hypothetical protein